MSTQLAVPNVASKDLATIATTAETRQKLVCKDMLKGDTPQRAKADAERAYVAMIENPLVIATYGSDALSGLNALVEVMFKDIQAGKDEEVAKMLKTLDKRLSDIQHKYDAKNPQFVAKYENARKGFLGIFGGTAAFWRQFLRDVKSVQSLVENGKQVIANNLKESEGIISRYRELKNENAKELNNVIYTVAVMEYIVDVAVKDIENIPQGDDHDTSEARGERADLIKNLNNRISAYKSRLFMGWLKSPQLRSQISLNIGVYGTVTITRDITFPMIKEVMINIYLLRKSKDIADMNNAFRQTLNESLQQYAVNAAVIVPLIEESVSAPLMAAQTIEVMRDAYVQQTEAVIKVIDESAEQNAVLDDLYLSTSKVVNTQSDKVSDAIIDRAVAATRKLEVSTNTLTVTA